MTDETTPQDGKAMSPASAGSQPVAWAVVNPSGGTRFLGLTQEDSQRVATGSERVRPVYWPVLTDEEREAIWTAAEAYAENDGDPECERIARVMQGLWHRTK